MTAEFILQVARHYIKGELRLTPTEGKLQKNSEERTRSKIAKFATAEGSTVEVSIRPRAGRIFSKTVAADGHTTFHDCEFRIMSVSDIWHKNGKPLKN